MTKHEVDRPYLTNEELSVLSSKNFSSERFNQVRDIFLFSCYTGLAYADTQKLSFDEIATGIDGEKWIFTHRKKTERPREFHYCPFAVAILDKYKNNAQCINKNRVLQVLSKPENE